MNQKIDFWMRFLVKNCSEEAVKTSKKYITKRQNWELWMDIEIDKINVIWLRNKEKVIKKFIKT